jgi:high-affinity iron transporter
MTATLVKKFVRFSNHHSNRRKPMLASFLLSLREGLEAALIISIVLGVLRKLNRQDLSSTVWAGVASAIVVSLAAGVGLYAIGVELEGQAEMIFEGLTILSAAGVLTWMIFWMNRQARTIKSEMESGVTRSVKASDKRGLFWLAFLAIVREGIELALFLTAATFATSAQATLMGTLLGLSTAILLGWALFTTTIRLDLRRFFQVTGILLILFAAGLVAHGVHELNEAGVIPSLIDPVWDISGLIPETTFIGTLLKTLFGYNANPSLTEMLAYFGYLAVVVIGLRATNKRAKNAESMTAQLQA